ncbi:hypothetical protein [Microbispora triticiradicis]|uniref:hypothetical protein n=1 Tax=Microbispora triticiradicis TaxID=2200763 RepID=UPI001AD6347E|nr:hypothetical protein [Microbispora triticiradicis]MBO4272386.1 hypothetical protein [Microbispora triticiradicis]
MLAALVDLAKLAMPPEVQVVDGQPIAASTDLLCVGYTGTPTEPAVEAAQYLTQLAPTPDREQYDVACLAAILRGNADAREVREAVFGRVGAVRSALARDPTLGDLVMAARLSVLDLTQQQTPKGALAEIRFAIHIDAYAR